MTQDQIDCINKNFEVFKEYLKGAKIQMKHKDSQDWEDLYNPSFNGIDLDYRVKPKRLYQVAYLFNGRDFITTSNRYESLEAFRKDKSYRDYKDAPAILLIHPNPPL